MRSKTYLNHVSSYKAEIYMHEMEAWSNAISSNQPLQPEVGAWLIGRAEPVFKRTPCSVCGKDIKLSQQVKASYEQMSKMYYRRELHQKCFERLAKI